MAADTIRVLGTVLFAMAVHTFSIKIFQHLALKFPSGSVPENLFHLVGEVEIIFGLWAGILIPCMTVLIGTGPAIEYVESVNFTEPMFVFVIMTVAATRPVIDFSVIPPREMVEPQRTQRAPRRIV